MWLSPFRGTQSGDAATELFASCHGVAVFGVQWFHLLGFEQGDVASPRIG